MEKNSDRTDSFYRRLAVILAIMLGCTVGLLFCIAFKWRSGQNTLSIMSAADIIKERYYFYNSEEIDDSKLTEWAIEGMIIGLDDVYADYYTEEEYENITKSESGEYYGIGIVILTPDSRGAEIQTVYENGPMEKAGAVPGDIIVSINGTKCADLSMNEVKALLLENESNDILLQREDQFFNVTVKNETVTVPYVRYKMLDNGIGYLYIGAFLGNVVSETENAVKKLLEDGMAALIVDVRNNPGGGLEEVLNICELFLQKGDLITSIRSRTEKERVYRAGKSRYTFPMAVIVNESSASASELFSGALKDHNRAVIVGTKTYGKGIVQSIYHLTPDKGWLKITTDAYYTPGGTCIQGTGIMPDDYVELPEDYKSLSVEMIPEEADLQLEQAKRLLNQNNVQ